MLTTNLSVRAGCAAFALVLVAGCGGSDDAEPKATKAPSTTAAPTTAAPAPAERPKDDKSDASALAFAEFVGQRVIAVTTGADLDEFLAMATPDCKGCINLAKQVQKDGTVKQEFDSAPVISDAKIIDQDEATGQILVEQVVGLSTGRKVDTATDKTIETFDEPTRLTMRVLMTWKEDRWRLTNYSAKDES
ncbi:hypothetical protein [Aeromicrobium wangtongii]|uniref:DUF4878 domain-containing protein n=1 Tax=Aeromicrobium wangtongii TaxID=2969247 RepID=A0ABY5M3E8_9ACTN|nr:hypothetical protein [Aeromicrobium wangtongii]MCD9199249.1 hypothetical protein [Aeromicrobium wangtongii]UUP12724.1 hypothetical protein NQV15_12780 [Aeromicrobium wangtongii]